MYETFDLQFRTAYKYDWDEAERLCPGDGEGLLAQMRTLDKDRPCPAYKDISDDYEDWSIRARFDGPLTGVEWLKEGKWKSYHLIGCCYT